MKILITGASGFIGRYLANDACARGHEVVATFLSRPELATGVETVAKVQWRQLDLRDDGSVRRLVRAVEPEAVFHLGAQAYAKRAWANPTDTFDTNVLGTIRLYEALREHPPARGVLLTASAAAYGIPPRLPVAEDAPLWATNPYGVSKACQEEVSFQYFQNFGLRIVRARLFGTTGPGKTGDALNDFARQVAHLEAQGAPGAIRVGNLDTRRDVSDIRDVIPALWRVFEAGDPAQAVNVGAGRSYSVRWIAEQLVGLAKVPLTIEVDPALLRPTDEPDNAADVGRLRALGHQPQFPLERTIRDALDYWRGVESRGTSAGSSSTRRRKPRPRVRARAQARRRAPSARHAR